jgi:TolB-like protein
LGSCRLSVLGGFALTSSDGADISLPTRKDRLLLAYLGLQDGRPQPREQLAGLLWAHRAEAQARDSLRQSLAGLRTALRRAGLEPLKSDRETVTLDITALDVDAVDFIRAAEAPTGTGQAIDIYRGALLSGIDPPTGEFEQWLMPERQRLEDMAARLVERITASTPSDAVADGAIRLARQLLVRDRLREPVHRALMRLLAIRDRPEALKAFAACRNALMEDLGIDPDHETETLYRDILTDRTATPAAAREAVASNFPDRPSIAVMPFANLTDDLGLAHLCEGLAEDITTGLGRFRSLFVIDRHSSLAVSQVTTDTAEIGKRLGAALLVQGSVKRLADGLRLTVRLVSAPTRALAWSNAYDCSLADVLSIPDRITGAIVTTLHSRVERSIVEQSRRMPALAAYECLLRGVRHLRSYGPDDNRLALELFREAVALDPGYALARAYLAFAAVVDNGYDATPADILCASRAMAEEAVEADPDDARAHWLLGMIYGCCRDFAAEQRQYLRAIALNPNDANISATYGVLLAALGRPEEGIDRIREAMRLNPYHPEWYWIDLAAALYAARRYGDAIEAYQQRTRPSTWVLTHLAACYAQLGRMGEAAEAAAEVMRLKPDFRISKLRSGGWTPPDIAHLAEGMRKAGLPE